MRIRLLVFCLLLGLSFGGCDAKEPASAHRSEDKSAAAPMSEPSGYDRPRESAPEEEARAASAYEAGAERKYDGRPTVVDALNQKAPEKKSPIERMIVYTAMLRLAVHSPLEALAQIEGVVAELGGYVQSSTRTRRVVRVPSARYHEAVRTLKGLGVVRDFSQSSLDVTEEFQDVVARMDNLQALKKRYEELLVAAVNMEERLAIERELRRISTELRILEERRRALSDQAAYATLTIDVEAIAPFVAAIRSPQPFGWVRSYGLASLYQ